MSNLKYRYVCKYGLYHDKPCKQGKPSSNNGWIYTAMAEALNLPVTDTTIKKTFNNCLMQVKNYGFRITRLPGKDTPPISKDEIIGLLSLGFINDGFLEMYNWYYGYEFGYSNSIWKKLKAVLYLAGKHRNTIWEEKVVDAYPLAFTLGRADRYYAKKIHKNKTTVLEWLAFHINFVFAILKTNRKTGNVSVKNMIWLQLYDMDSKFLIKLINRKKNFVRYFGKDHVFNKGV